MSNPDKRILLGIDTGGTYTDAVLLSEANGVLGKAKSVTTKQDLSLGISRAIDNALNLTEVRPESISLVSLSTTLATNALVENKGSSVGLIMIGFDEADMEKAGLKASLGHDPVLFLPGGHDVHGNERPLNTQGLWDFVESHKDQVGGFAVAGYFAVRNSSHELKVRDEITKCCRHPVTCSHELTSKLGGPKRALTTLLNARLIPIIRDLVAATRKHLKEIGIVAPVMVVRGDGALVSAEFAFSRPIETILSGPAASLIGARYLLGSDDAVVSDIGGTTTDIAILEKGWPRIDLEGAEVGGLRTMVEAVAMRTFGLGGDSEIHLDEENPDTKLRLGPRRLVPLSLLATEFPDIVLPTLQRQAKEERPSQLTGKFVSLSGHADPTGHTLRPTETKLLSRLDRTPQPLATLLSSASESGTLNQLVSKGLAVVSGLTPSDAMHVLGLQNNWNGEAAHLGASIFARLRDRMGNDIASSALQLCETVKQQLELQSCNAILSSLLQEDKVAVGPGANAMLSRALKREPGFVQLRISLDRQLVGLGASAKVYYPQIGERLGTISIIPEHADVANAIGAVTADVRVRQEVVILSPDGGKVLTCTIGDETFRYTDEEEAIHSCRKRLEQMVTELAISAGASDPKLETVCKVLAPEADGNRQFIEARLTVAAIGKPAMPDQPMR